MYIIQTIEQWYRIKCICPLPLKNRAIPPIFEIILYSIALVSKKLLIEEILKKFHSIKLTLNTETFEAHKVTV